MKLRKFSISQFQSFDAAQTTTFHEHLTLLAGRNNVGKSALLRALQIPVTPQDGGRAGSTLSYCWSIDADTVSAFLPVTAGDPAGHEGLLRWLVPKHAATLVVEADFACPPNDAGRTG